VFKNEGISAATALRPSPRRCLSALTAGDMLAVWKLDRLGAKPEHRSLRVP